MPHNLLPHITTQKDQKLPRNQKKVSYLKECVVITQASVMEHMVIATLKKATISEEQSYMALFIVPKD
jgi:hypothetical protein